MGQRVFPQLRMTDWQRTRQFYIDGLGFAVDWEHRFEPGFPVFAQLLEGPRRGRMRRDVDVQQLPRCMMDEYEDVQGSKRRCDCYEEVTGDDRLRERDLLEQCKQHDAIPFDPPNIEAIKLNESVV